MAVLDNYQRMFIGTAFRVGEGDLVERKQDRQDDKSHNAPPNTIIIDVAQPPMVKKYHDGVGAIDGHNSIQEKCWHWIRLLQMIGAKGLTSRSSV
jgi:hypothetical protein